MKIVRLFSFIILIGAYLSADTNSGNLPAPIPIDFGVNYGMRSDSTICESCNQEYDAGVMGASCCDEAYEFSVGSDAYPNGITCGVLEGDYVWNCSGCTCPSDEDWTTIFGCKDALACNYNSNAIWDYGMCNYADGICQTCVAGEVVDNVDECGVCDGDGIADGECDCAGNIADCAGECGGSALEDECGECGGDSSSCADCAGVPNGDAEFDECGECGGDGADVMCDDGNYVCDESDCGGSDITDGCELPDLNLFLSADGSVFYNSSIAIAGFQFNVDGATINSASGGDAAAAGMFIQASGNFVLGFSMTGGTFGPGCGTMVQLDLTGDATGLSGIIISDAAGGAIPFVYYVGGGEPIIGCMDETACNYNPDATEDDGSCLENDCAGECGGSAALDDCGICNGGNADDLGCGCFEEGPSGCDNACGSELENDECGVCGGSGIPEGECDCNGNVEDCAGVCSGSSIIVTLCEDTDGDGLGNPGSETEECIDGGRDITDGCELPDLNLFLSADGSVFYNSSIAIAGFQFNVDGATINSTSGGDAAAAGMFIQASGNFVLGFSMTGGTFGPGCGTMVQLDLTGDATGISGIIISDAAGGAIPFVYYVGDDTELVADCTDEYPDCADNYYDCYGECGGSAVEDECGVCDGSGIPDGDCDCAGNVEDCAGQCGGDATADNCGTCDNDSSNDCVQDCNGNWGGTDELDECEVCGGGNADDLGCGCFEPAALSYCPDTDGDFQGDWNSVADYCLDDVPEGWIEDCTDPEPDCATNDTDECGVCHGSGIADGECDCDGNVEDCAGQCGGDATADNCGTCDNDPGNDCLDDCNGVAGGDAVEDNCGTCDSDSSNDCVQDCAGTWGGTAELDECEVCGGDGIADSECDCDGNVEDCAGECGGSALEDECGVCGGGGIADGECDCAGNIADCAGECGGSALEDECGECGGEEIDPDNCGPICMDDPPICNPGMYSIVDETDCINLGGSWEGYFNYWGHSCEAVVTEFNGNCEEAPLIQYWELSDLCPVSCGECCDDDSACNDGDMNNGCEYPEDFGACDCDGNVDAGCGCGEAGPSGCDNACGSTLENDECDICGGSGIPDGACDCDGNVLDDCNVCDGDNSTCADCAGVPNGNNEVDNCGECDTDSTNDCVPDCNGDWGGSAEVDCAGNCDGTWALDACGICGDGYSTASSIAWDCNDVCFGGNVLDECDICGGSGIPDGACDCAGNVDLGCGCGADGPSGCDEECGSSLENDECGICGGDGIAEGDCDCDGNILDECGVCGGDNTSCSWTELSAAVEEINNITLIWDPFVISSGDRNSSGNRSCSSGVCLSIDNVDTDAGTLDIYMVNQSGCTVIETDGNVFYSDMSEVDCASVGNWFNGGVGGFNFTMTGIDIGDNSSAATGGSMAENSFVVTTVSLASGNPNIVGFSLTGSTIPPGSGVLFTLSFSSVDSNICIPVQFNCEGGISDTCPEDLGANGVNTYDNNPIISDTDANVITTSTDCYCVPGLDQCGVCGGDNSSCADCAGILNGSAYFDNCGTCDNDSSNDCVQDCAGVWDGDSYFDNCGTCDNDSSNDCDMDCFGEWGGSLVNDECGECDGPGAQEQCWCLGFEDEYANIELGDCTVCEPADCPLDPESLSYYIYRNGLGIPIDQIQQTEFIDEGLDYDTQYCYTVTYIVNNIESDHSNQSCAITGEMPIIPGCMSTYACNYDENATVDDGSCWFANTGCSCDDDQDALADLCGVCDTDPENNCTVDCTGVPGGNAVEDACGVCDGDGILDGECDCAGNVDLGCGCGEAGPSGCDNECGSTAVVDECGVCGGDGILDGECDCDGNVEDCLGECGGTAIVDECGVCNGGNASMDECGVCGGDGPEEGFNCDGMPLDFVYNQSTEQAFYFFEIVTINGMDVEGDDWVGAFNGEVCVGARKWDASSCGNGMCDVPVMGNDGSGVTEGYMMTGDIPSFKIYDASENTYYDAVASEDIP